MPQDHTSIAVIRLYINLSFRITGHVEKVEKVRTAPGSTSPFRSSFWGFSHSRRLLALHSAPALQYHNLGAAAAASPLASELHFGLAAGRPTESRTECGCSCGPRQEERRGSGGGEPAIDAPAAAALGRHRLGWTVEPTIFVFESNFISL